MMKKRILSLILVLCLTVGFVPVISAAEPVTGVLGDNVTWSFNPDSGTLTVSGEGEMTEESTGANPPWNDYDAQIKTVVIGDGITRICMNAFRNFTYLTEVSLPAGLREIADMAFFGCSNLEGLELPEGMTTIGPSAFVNSGLLSISIPDSVTHIGNGAFADCAELVSVKLPAGLVRAEGSVFYGCTNLSEVVMPFMENVESFKEHFFRDCDSLTNISFYGASFIDANMFSECDGLVEITIPDCVTRIGQESYSYAFKECANLTTVTIPASVEVVGACTFQNCENLTEVFFQGDAPVFGDDVFTGCTVTVRYPRDNESWTEDVLQPYGGAVTWIPYREGEPDPEPTEPTEPEPTEPEPTEPEPTVPDGEGTYGENILWSYSEGTLTVSGSGEMTGSMGDYPWESYRNQAERIVVEPGITAIGDYAFMNFSTVTEVTLPEGLLTIGSYAFEWCDGLTGIELPQSLTVIENDAFNDTGLEEIVIPDSVTDLGARAFAYCYDLERVTLPRELTIISDSLFYNCESLTAIDIPDTVEYIESSAFNNTGLKRVEIPAGVTSLTYYVFADCEDLEEVILNEGLTTLGMYCFQNCTSLKSLTLPDSLTDLFGDGTFEGSGLVELHIPQGPTSIGWWTFRNCPNLTKVTMGSSITSVGKEAFTGCPNLETVVLSENVTQIDEMAFHDSGLIEIVIPEGVTYINPETFLNCTRLKTVELPESLEEISRSAFRGCTSLKTVGLPTRLQRIMDDAFRGSGLTWVEIPMSVESIYGAAFGYCPNLTAAYFPESMLYIHGGTFVESDRVTIYCYKGSRAHEFALNSGLPYVLRTGDGSIFSDVSTDQYYYKPVMWAVEKGITTGTGNGKFSPNMICTRGQVVTFLWRAAGEPEPASTENPFTDVKSSDYFYKAVLWAVENGITTGMGDGKFSPNMACTRGQVATFLWRTLGCPEPGNYGHTFRDLEYGAYYYEAVLWAVDAGVTTGIDNNRFAPNASCTRGQIVTFLYRAFG